MYVSFYISVSMKNSSRSFALVSFLGFFSYMNVSLHTCMSLLIYQQINQEFIKVSYCGLFLGLFSYIECLFSHMYVSFLGLLSDIYVSFHMCMSLFIYMQIFQESIKVSYLGLFSGSLLTYVCLFSRKYVSFHVSAHQSKVHQSLSSVVLCFGLYSGSLFTYE